MENISEILKMLSSSKQKARQSYHAEIKAVFGSYVRGQQKPDSDVDVLVEFDADADLLDFVGLSQFLEESIGHAVDIVPVDSIREEIRQTVLHEAVYL